MQGKTGTSDNKLIRVDWQGTEQSHMAFDTSHRVTAFLQYEKSLGRDIPNLKSTFERNVYLEEIEPEG